MHYLDILVVFGLDLGQICFNLVEIAITTGQLAFLATGIMHYDIWTRACAEIKILTYVFRLFDFWNLFLVFPFSPFLFFLLQRLTFYWACLRLKHF